MQQTKARKASIAGHRVDSSNPISEIVHRMICKHSCSTHDLVWLQERSYAVLVPTNMRAFRVGLGGMSVLSMQDGRSGACFSTVSPETRARSTYASRFACAVVQRYPAKLGEFCGISCESWRICCSPWYISRAIHNVDV